VRQGACVPELIINIGWVVVGLVFLYFGAEWLVRGSSEMAIRFGISPLVVGLTVVAFGTSAVVGSNICNIALVLGFGAVIFPLAIQRQVIRREMPVLLVASTVFLLMMRDGEMDRLEAAVLFGGIVLYVITSLVEAKKEDLQECDDVPPELVEAARKGGAGRLYLNIFLVVLGGVVLVVGADRMVFGGERIARSYGVPEAIIGLTLFAFGTSLPELATSVVAAFKKQGDIIVGNAVGSCIFNLLAVVGMAGLIAPLEGVGVTSVHYGVMLGVAIILMPMMWHRMKLDRWEGVLLVIGYLGFTSYLVLA